jgi:hypothetical protein
VGNDGAHPAHDSDIDVGPEINGDLEPEVGFSYGSGQVWGKAALTTGQGWMGVWARHSEVDVASRLEETERTTAAYSPMHEQGLNGAGHFLRPNTARLVAEVSIRLNLLAVPG